VGVYRDGDIGVELPVGYKTILEGDGRLAKRAREFMVGRQYNLDYLDSIGVGYCDEKADNFGEDYFGYIIVPYRRQNNLYYFKGRTFLDNPMKHKYPKEEDIGIGKSEILFNEDILEFESEVFINESDTDSMTLRNAVAVGGLTLSPIHKSKLLTSPVGTFIVALDGGYYQKGLLMAWELLEHKEVYVLDLPEGEDVNSLGAQEVAEIYEDTDPMDFNTLLRELDEHKPIKGIPK